MSFGVPSGFRTKESVGLAGPGSAGSSSEPTLSPVNITAEAGQWGARRDQGSWGVADSPRGFVSHRTDCSDGHMAPAL